MPLLFLNRNASAAHLVNYATWQNALCASWLEARLCCVRILLCAAASGSTRPCKKCAKV